MRTLVSFPPEHFTRKEPYTLVGSYRIGKVFCLLEFGRGGGDLKQWRQEFQGLTRNNKKY
jgi:hypothetical protein